MPLINTNHAIQWGKHGKKYGYKIGNKKSRTTARNKALRQMRAIKVNQIKRKRHII